MRKFAALCGALGALVFVSSAMADETLTLDTYSPLAGGLAGPVQTTQALMPTAFYLVTVQGTFSFWNPAFWAKPQSLPNCGAPEAAPMFPSPGTAATGPVGIDAETIFGSPNGQFCSATQTLPIHHPQFVIDTGSGVFSYVTPEGGPYSAPTANHAYTYLLQGSGSAGYFAFGYHDSPLSDNYGALRITVHRTTGDDCKKGGWVQFGVFKNQGDCVSYMATNGRNLPSGYE